MTRKRHHRRTLTLKGFTVWFDVDDTLVLWNMPRDYSGPKIHVTQCNEYRAVVIDQDLAINTAMVARLKEAKRYGHNVVVWSVGGYRWAETVVKALGLVRYVDVIANKPNRIYDDLGSAEWMPTPRLELPPGWVKKLGGVFYTGTVMNDDGTVTPIDPEESDEH